MNIFKKLTRKIITWAFKEELDALELDREDFKNLKYMLNGDENSRVSISADIHQNSNSWAVISSEGKERDSIKFIDLGRRDMVELQKFLKNFERRNIDSAPYVYPFLKGVWL